MKKLFLLLMMAGTLSHVQAQTKSKILSVGEAVAIGSQLDNLEESEDAYYIKGIVRSFNMLKHENSMAEYGVALFYMCDSLNALEEIYGYQVYSINGYKFSSLDQIAIGDTVIVYSKLFHYNGSIETVGKEKAFLCYSSNPLAYPMQDFSYYTEDFETSLNGWTEQAVTDPGMIVWQHNTAISGSTSAVAQATDNQGDRLKSEVWLVSPAIDLTQQSVTQPILTFKTYYQKGTVQGASDPNVKDYLRLKISQDGSHWTDMEIPNFGSGKLPIYELDSVDVSAYIGPNMRIAFAYSSTTDFAPKWVIAHIHIGESKRVKECTCQADESSQLEDIEVAQSTTSKGQKILRDGQLYIQYRGKRYNTNGIEIKK